MPDPTPPGRCPPSPDPARRVQERREPYLRDTLAVLPAVEDGPGNAAGVLALEEQRLGLAVLEPEDLAVATDVQLTLRCKTRSELSSSQPKQIPPSRPADEFPTPVLVWRRLASGSRGRGAARLGGGKFGVGRNRWNGPSVPCRGRSAGRRKNRRTFSFWRWLSSCRCRGCFLRVEGPRSKVPGRFSPNSLVQVVG